MLECWLPVLTLYLRRDVRAIPLISASRWLVRRGECTRLSWKEGEKMTFGRRVTKHQLTLFLLTDLLLVTKKKGEERFLVLDYTPRNMVQVGAAQHNTLVPQKVPSEGS